MVLSGFSSGKIFLISFQRSSGMRIIVLTYFLFLNKIRYIIRSQQAIFLSIFGIDSYYLASPLFISTEVNEPLPTSAVESEAYQKFITMSEEEKLDNAKQMSLQERDEIMTITSKINNSVALLHN